MKRGSATRPTLLRLTSWRRPAVTTNGQTNRRTDGRTASCRVRVGVRCSGLEALSDALIYVQ